jgi:hypothetical protein
MDGDGDENERGEASGQRAAVTGENGSGESSSDSKSDSSKAK